MRLATWNVELERRGPGLLLRDLQRAEQPQIRAIIRVLLALDADILLLTGFDYDRGQEALRALAALLRAEGLDYFFHFSRPPNSGVPTGFDLDGDGRLGGPRDAQGYGAFPGQASMALLSRLPLLDAQAVDLTPMLWRDLPGAIAPPMPEAQRARQRLSSVGHWIVPVLLPDGRHLSLLSWYATPPVFDGAEDRNGRRNHDETAIWLRLFEGDLPVRPPVPPFVVIGDANLDPVDGDGRAEALRALLASPRLRDPQPRGDHGRVEPRHRGDPALDTALYPQAGGLRVEYILPSADLELRGAGVLWPAAGQDMPGLARDAPARRPDLDEAPDLSMDLETASRHRPVWVDIAIATGSDAGPDPE